VKLSAAEVDCLVEQEGGYTMKVEFRSCLAWNSVRTVTAATTVPLLLGFTPHVLAQTQSASADASRGTVIEEVMVTAQRREENWKDVPISVASMSGDLVETLAITDIRDLSDYVPGFTVRSFNVQTPEISIRGVGSQTLTHITDDLSVGFFLDDVYLSRGAGQKAELFDLERVEVLRGPQGTLFGRNTIGGLVNVTTKKPTEEFEGKASLTVGDYNLVKAQGMLNLPLIKDRLLARLVVGKENHDGYQKNVFDQARFDQQVALDPRISEDDLVMDNDGNEADDLSWRLKLRGIISERSEVMLTVDSEKRRPGGLLTGQYVRQPRSFQWTRAPAPAAVAPYANEIYVGLGSISPTRFQHRPYSPAIDPPNDLRNSFYGQVGNDKIDHDGISLHANYDFDNASLIFVGSKRELTSQTQEDLDASYGDYANRFDTEDGETDSLELRIESNDEGAWSLGGKLHWSAGVYQFEEDVSKTLDGFARLTRGNSYGSQEVHTESLGIFGQLTWKVTDRLSLTAGYRYTDEDKSGLLTQIGRIAINFGDTTTYIGRDACVAAIVANPALIGLTTVNVNEVINGTTVGNWLRNPGGKCQGPTGTPYQDLAVQSSDAKGTAKLALNYALTPETSMYFSFSQGFKSTAFNGGANNPVDARTIYEPEFLNLYEVGIKVQDDSGRFKGSAAMFYNDFTDFKQPKFSFDSTNPNQGISAGKGDTAEIMGFEIDASIVLFDNLLLTLATNRLHARLQKYSALDGTKLSSLDIVRIPSASHYVSAKYTFPELSFGQFSARADLVAEEDSINMVPLSDITQLTGRTGPLYNAGNGGDRVVGWQRLDAQVEFASASGTWNASLWGRNLTDELYYTRSSVNFVDPEAVINAFWQEPRTFGVTVNYRF